LSSVCADGRRDRRQSPSRSTLAIFRSILMLVRLWRERICVRRQLAAMSARELQDMATCWSEIAVEAGEPFWRE